MRTIAAVLYCSILAFSAFAEYTPEQFEAAGIADLKRFADRFRRDRLRRNSNFQKLLTRLKKQTIPAKRWRWIRSYLSRCLPQYFFVHTKQ